MPWTAFPTWKLLFLFFNDTATTEIYTLSLHDALPISIFFLSSSSFFQPEGTLCRQQVSSLPSRSEENTSELQSLTNLVCRLLLDKKQSKVKVSSSFLELFKILLEHMIAQQG